VGHNEQISGSYVLLFVQLFRTINPYCLNLVTGLEKKKTGKIKSAT